MKKSGVADLPLHYGHVPQWLADRMGRLGFAITEAIITEYGVHEMLRRLSSSFWFQSLGAVMGMDWHSSGITTSVMGALKKSLNPHAKDLGIYICGGKGKYATGTPKELMQIADTTGLDGNALAQYSRLSAKVDNTAVQDGYQLYLHHFIVSATGEWTVVQQGMHTADRTARRYHWHSAGLRSFIDEPHTGVCGINQGEILNFTAHEADGLRKNMLMLATEKPQEWMATFERLVMPSHHQVKSKDVNLKRLGTVLWLAHEKQPKDFEELLLLQGVGPRTLQSLALVSEVIHGTPSRFKDPARFSFAHGGKDGHPFPVPTQVYDETIDVLQNALQKARLGQTDKNEALKKLHQIANNAEAGFTPVDNFDALIEKERAESWKYGGKTVFGDAKPPRRVSKSVQLRIF